jgi:allantoicase
VREPTLQTVLVVESASAMMKSENGIESVTEWEKRSDWMQSWESRKPPLLVSGKELRLG